MTNNKLKEYYYKIKSRLFGQMDSVENWSDKMFDKIQKKQKELDELKAKVEQKVKEKRGK